MSVGAAPSLFVLETISTMGEEELDALPYGVIQVDAQGVILRYNKCESRLSGLAPQDVIGKNFFREVAPCTQMKDFYGRFCDGVAAGKLHCTFRYHFAFGGNPRDVTITLFLNDRKQTVWLLVQDFKPEKTEPQRVRIHAQE